MKKLNLIIGILFTIVCFGCKDTFCPGFPKEINYFPYHRNQELTFEDSQQSVCTFRIIGGGNSESWSYKWNCKCECGAESSFQMIPILYTSDMNYLFVNGTIQIFGGEGAKGITMSLYFSSSEYLTKRLYEDKKIFQTKINEYLEDTISIENNNNKLVKKVVIVKNKGLVSYTTADGEEWKLAE